MTLEKSARPLTCSHGVTLKQMPQPRLRATDRRAVLLLRTAAHTIIHRPWHASSLRRLSVSCMAMGEPSNFQNMKQHAEVTDQTGGWNLLGFPSYLQNTQARPFPCEEPRDLTSGNGGRWKREQMIWNSVRHQAQVDAAAEPLLSSYLYASVLAHDSFEKALAFVLANRLANTTLLPTQLFEIFVEVLQNDDDVRCGALADVEAVVERDPSCLSLLQPLLYSKGYHAIQTHRIAHALWSRGQRVIALALQSRSSEVFAVDIHPAANLGKGLLLDHGTGVVIGETVVIGDNCSMLQNVTLGGTGKETGDRHPKIADNVLIGANATVLGNITIGRGAQIAAGSLVLKRVEPCTMVAGSPAKEVGKVIGNPAQTMSHWQNCPPCSADDNAQARVASSTSNKSTVDALSLKDGEAIKLQPSTVNQPVSLSAAVSKESPVTGRSAAPQPHWNSPSPDTRHSVVDPVLPGEGI